MAKFGLPGLSSKLPADVRQFLERVREFVSGSDGYLTRKELADAGVITVNDYGRVISGNQDEASLLSPPAPTNVTASGAITNILLEWDAPTYRNHAYAEIWASGTDNLGEAVRIGTTPAFLFAHAVGAGQTRYYWVRFVSKADIVGPYNATVGVHGATSNDPAWLIEVLTNQLSEDQLVAGLNTRINLIEHHRDILKDHQGLLRRLDKSIESAAEATLNAALKLSKVDSTITDAGVTIDPATGEVYIYGLREAQNRLSSAEVRIDGVESTINLKASVAYVDQAIATAAINPTQIAALDDVYARLTTAEADINGAEASITLKASQTELNGINGRLVTAESEIDVLQGQIVLKAETTTVNNLDTRLNTAENTLSTIGGASIVQSVASVRQLQRDADKAGEAQLAGLLFADRNLTSLTAAIATAKNELYAHTNEGLTAEAGARLALAAQVSSNAAEITNEAIARANATGALTNSINTLSNTVGDHTTAIQDTTEVVDGVRALRMIKIDNNGVMSGYGLASDLTEGGAVTSKFIASVDEFAVVAPMRTAGTLASVPFVVLTTAQTINGVPFEPGVYIDGASINSGTVGNAQIGNAAIDNAKIANLSAAKVIFGEMSGDRIAANTLNADRITVNSLAARLAVIDTAYIDEANINDGQITNAKIGTASITAAKIQDASITSAKIVSLDAGKIMAASLSAISANLGTITAGRAQNGAGTFFVDFNAAGYNDVFNANNKAIIRADGSAYFDGVIISREQVERSGTYNLVATGAAPVFRQSYDDNGLSFSQLISGRDTFFIDTGFDDYNSVLSVTNYSFVGDAYVSAGYVWYGSHPGGNQLYTAQASVSVVRSIAHYVSGIGGPPLGRVMLKVVLSIDNMYPSLSQVRLDSFSWALKRVT